MGRGRRGPPTALSAASAHPHAVKSPTSILTCSSHQVTPTPTSNTRHPGTLLPPLICVPAPSHTPNTKFNTSTFDIRDTPNSPCLPTGRPTRWLPARAFRFVDPAAAAAAAVAGRSVVAARAKLGNSSAGTEPDCEPQSWEEEAVEGRLTLGLPPPPPAAPLPPPPAPMLPLTVKSCIRLYSRSAVVVGGRGGGDAPRTMLGHCCEAHKERSTGRQGKVSGLRVGTVTSRAAQLSRESQSPSACRGDCLNVLPLACIPAPLAGVVDDTRYYSVVVEVVD